MAAPKTNLPNKRAVILSVLLVAVISCGFSQTMLHAHAGAEFGHVHDVHDPYGPVDAGSDEVDESGNDGVLHGHDIGPSAIALVPVFDVNIVAHRQADGETPPPTAKPPDNLIIPLYRPPIV